MKYQSRGISTQEREIIGSFSAAQRATVGVDDVLRIQNISRPHANRILSRLAAKGWLVRLRRGVYSVVPLGAPSPAASVEDAWAVATTLFAPAYISGWTAAEHWSFTDQIFNAVAVVTGKLQRQREQSIAGIRFVCRSIPANKIFGTTRIWSGSTQVLVADPHRTVIDILASPEMGGGARHVLDIVKGYWRSKHANPDKLLEYAERYAKGVVFKRIGFTTELFHTPSDQWLQRCQKGLTKGISLLDPSGPKRGKIVSRWRLRINIPTEIE